MRHSKYKIPFYLFIVLFLSHGLAIFSNSIYWDGALLYGFYQENNIEQLKLMAFSMGEPIYYWIHRFLWLFGYGYVFNAVCFLSIYAVAISAYFSVKLYSNSNNLIAALVALFILVFPGSFTTAQHATSQYYVLYALFACAFYFGLKYEVSNNAYFRMLSLFLFFVSFNLKSLLTLYLLFYCCQYILYSERKSIKFISLRNIIGFVRVRIDFFVIPFLYFIISIIWFKPYAEYVGYNGFVLQTSHQLLYYFSFSIAMSCLRYIWLPTIVFLGVFLFMRKRVFFIQWAGLSKGFVYVGVITLILVIIPYLLIAKYIIYNTITESRFSLFMPIPMAMLLTGIVCSFFCNPDGTLTLLGKVFVAIFSAFFLLICVSKYLQIEAEYSMNKSFILQMKKHKNWGAYSSYWILNDWSSHFHKYATIYDWAWLLNEAYSGHSRYGFSVENEGLMNKKTATDHAYAQSVILNVRNYNKNGSAAHVHVVIQNAKPHRFDEWYYEHVDGKKISYLLNPFSVGVNPGLNYLELGARSLYWRFIKPRQYNNFVDSLIVVHLTPLYTIAGG